MLQNLRDNLKGTVAIIVIIIFVVPLVLFGVEQLFVGSAGSSGAASVNGVDIKKGDLQRELVLEKQRRQERFQLEANSPQLEDSVLVGPVLKRMTRRLALYQAATDGGMGASKEVLWKQIGQIEAFQKDGKLDYDLFKERISYLYTTSSFLDASAHDLVLQHVNQGISDSTFVTEEEIALLAAITKQKRSFFSVTIPKESAETVDVTDDEIAEYYKNNTSNYVTPEEVTVEYVELSLEDIAKTVDVSEADVRAAFDVEVSSFVADPKYTVAHILVKTEKDKASKVSEISAKLAAKEDFSVLAKEYSEDLGSKNNGGNLGEMVKDAYPAAFVKAAKALEVGKVSGPVETDAGTHFIKLLAKTNTEAPSFADRKESIKRQLSLDSAQELYAKKIEVLGDTTFSSDSLNQAAESLSLTIKESKPFGKTGGANGISTSPEVAKAAFADDVLLESHNSPVIELPDNKAVVLRLKKHSPEAVKPLVLVKTEIRYQLITEKKDQLLSSKADELRSKISIGAVVEDLAKELSYEYKLNKDATRSSFDLGGEVVQKVFSLARPVDSNTPVLDVVKTQAGAYAVVGLLSVEDGVVADMEAEQVEALRGQLAYQLGQLELSVFENAVVNNAKINVPQ